MKTSRLTPTLVAVATACALAACGSSSGTSPSTGSAAAVASTSTASTSATSTAASTSSTAPATTGAAPSTPGKLTKPGTNLHVGQTAKVAFSTLKKNGSDGPSYTLAITVMAITPGSMADFKGITLTGVHKGDVPTYVHLRMANVGSNTEKTGTDDPAYSIGAVNGDDLDSALILTGDFPKCPQVDTPNPFVAGKSFATCQIFFERSAVKQVGYNGSDATVDQPVTWSK